MALFSELLENVIGSAGGACSGEGKSLELEQSNLVREIGQAFIGDVICQKGFTQLESCIDRTTINVAVASPDNRGMRLPYRPQCGETPPFCFTLAKASDASASMASDCDFSSGNGLEKLCLNWSHLGKSISIVMLLAKLGVEVFN